MQQYERTYQQLNDYYSFALSVLNFLQKYLGQFHRALAEYSTALRHIHIKSSTVLQRHPPGNDLIQHLHHGFVSLLQTFDDEYHQVDQRARLVRQIQSTVKTLHQQVNASSLAQQKHQLRKYSSRLHRHQKRPDRHAFVKHDRLATDWRNQLDTISSASISILWKLFSYSPYKFDLQPGGAHSPSASVNEPLSAPTIDSPAAKKPERVPSISQMGAGDQLPAHGMIANSNNGCAVMVHRKSTREDNHSLGSSEIDERLVQNNELGNDSDDDDKAWIRLVEQNELQWEDLTSSDESSHDTASSITHLTRIEALHLSDLSYTTDYYSQYESS